MPDDRVPTGVARIDFLTKGNRVYAPDPATPVPDHLLRGPLVCQSTGDQVYSGLLYADGRFEGWDHVDAWERGWWDAHVARRHRELVREGELAELPSVLALALQVGGDVDRFRDRRDVADWSDELAMRREQLLDWVLTTLANKPQPTSYEATLVVLFRSGVAAEGEYGLVCSAVRNFDRFRKTSGTESTGRYFGTVSERIEVTVTVARIAGPYPGEYGDSYLCVMQKADEPAVEFIWWTGENLALEEQRTYRIRGTVADHTEYNGIKQTRLARVVDQDAPKKPRKQKGADDARNDPV